MAHQRSYLQLPPGYPVPVAGNFPDGHMLRRELRPEPALLRLLYGDVGRDCHWTDRAQWNDEQWTLHGLKPQIQVWVLWDFSQPAAFFELRREEDDVTVEIAYFGVRPAWRGRGWSKLLLARAVHHAREWRAEQVWLHTCTKDHPAALPLYLAHGFEVFRTEAID